MLRSALGLSERERQRRASLRLWDKPTAAHAQEEYPAPFAMVGVPIHQEFHPKPPPCPPPQPTPPTGPPPPPESQSQLPSRLLRHLSGSKAVGERQDSFSEESAVVQRRSLLDSNSARSERRSRTEAD